MAAAAMAYQAQEFGLTLIGVGLAAGFASSTAAAIRSAAGAYTAVTAAANVGAASAPAAGAAATSSAASLAAPDTTPADMLVEQALTAAAAASLEGAYKQPATVGLSDIKAQLRAAADAAVAAVKSAAAADGPAPAQRRAAQTEGAPNGAAVRPGMTVEEASKQVKEWIEAWRGSAATDAEPAPAAPVEVPSGAPTTRVAEPTLHPSAAAVLSAMTADAPVANTPMDATPAAAIESQQQQEEGREEPEPVLAAVAAPAAPADTEPSAAEKEVAYKVADTKAAQGSVQEQAERRKAVEVAPEHLAKISTLLADSKEKRAREQESLARSEALLRKLADQEAEERRQLAAAAAAAQPSTVVQQQPAGVFAQLLQQLAAVLRTVTNFVQKLVAHLTGGSSSAAGASA
ncbi:hypothetical protein ABPG77_010644 [Micractinium sp. CCAP 211/92]